MALVEVKDLVKTYEDNGVPVQALRGVSLEVESGEFTAIAGPSGSGKTTLLNLIGGLDAPSGGRVVVAGKDLSRMKKGELAEFRLHNLGFIFQAYNLIPVLSALENVEFVMLLQGIDAATRRARAQAILDEMGIGEFAHRRPNELSGGQQQRVAVARAIVAEPKLVLADEPTANLDSKTGERLLELMRQMNESKGVTFIFSTHDRMVMEHSRRLVQLRDGQIVSDEVRA
jgi:putative ABC transport system ATP-binding protein